MLPPVTCLADLPADAGIGPLLNTRGEQLIILVQGTEARTHMGCSQNLPKEMSSVRSLNTKGLPLTCKLSIQFNSIQFNSISHKDKKKYSKRADRTRSCTETTQGCRNANEQNSAAFGGGEGT
jgi:hypothetical protein